MKMKMRELEAVDVDYPANGPHQQTFRQVMPVPVSTLFNCLADGPAWKEWLGIDVEWTSPEPRGIGTTRTVTSAGVKIEEYYLRWVDNERMTFRFDRTNLPVRAFAEDYRFVAIDADTSEMYWTIAFEWGGPLDSVLGKGFAAGFGFNAKRSLKKLATLLADDPNRFADKPTEPDPDSDSDAAPESE